MCFVETPGVTTIFTTNVDLVCNLKRLQVNSRVTVAEDHGWRLAQIRCRLRAYCHRPIRINVATLSHLLVQLLCQVSLLVPPWMKNIISLARSRVKDHSLAKLVVVGLAFLL